MKGFLRPFSRPSPSPICIQCRHFSSSLTPPARPNARWLSETKARLGNCIMFGLSREQARRAGVISKIIGEEWRALTVGREGFLSADGRAGLLKHKVVWGEMDSMGHVNNVAYTRYAESARVQWAYNYARLHDRAHREQWEQSVTSRGLGMILKSIRTDYKFPMAWPDHITVLHKLAILPSKGDDSFTLDVVILSELHQRASARCFEDVVVYNYQKGKKEAIPPWMLEAFERTWEEQKAEENKVGQRVIEVDRLIKTLEDETWAKDGAVEDLGSGSNK